MDRVVVLTPVYNGKKYIKQFLEKHSPFVDGFVFLDDGSTDGTFDDVNSSKVIKIIKKERTNDDFDDAENRNILLNEARKIKCRWFLWIDIDEILYVPNNNVFRNIDHSYNILVLPKIHLWNSEHYYNSEYPYSNKGIQYKQRGFNRSIFEYRLATPFRREDKLHFSLLPIDKNNVNDYIVQKCVIIHYANLHKEDRILRYNMYHHLDKNLSNQSIGYDHLLNHSPSLGSVEKLKEIIDNKS